ncbi:MAG: hypothetical protein DWG76_07710 [Chloroflexi bacterium]|nr:hypothetical protein [Chloroflexota bacterium]MQC27312.1 hypothetical protein [Chloroflexota bacterium]
MGTGELGKWAWLIALWVAVLGGILATFGVDVLGGGIFVSVVGVLAFLGGWMHLAGMDRTAFYIAAAALGWFAASSGDWFGVSIISDLVMGILGGAAVAAAAGAAGVLMKTVYEWVMP